MAKDTRQQARRVFMEVADLPEVDRGAALSKACGGDGTLRGEVEALLRAEQQAGGFMRSPTGGVPAGHPASAAEAATLDSAAAATMVTPLREGPGTRIGPYKLLQLVGEGGFGTVFMAEQENPTLRWVVEPLMDAYSKVGATAKAAGLVRGHLALAREELPPESPQLASALAQFGLVLLEMREWTEVEPLLRECLAIREKTAPDDWRTLNTRSMLGGALLGQNKLAEAEPLLLDGYRGMKKREAAIPPQAAARIPEALERLARLYEAKGNEPEAAAWRGTLEAAKAEQAKAGENRVKK